MWFIRIGTKITGPHSEAQLRSMRERGQFSPLHQISKDRQRWEPAAPLVQMFDATKSATLASQWTPKEQTAATGVMQQEESKPDKIWYYLDASRKQQGPITQIEMEELARLGVIHQRTLLCRMGGGDWTAAAELPFLKHLVARSSGRWKGRTLVGGAIAAALLLIGVPLVLYAFGGLGSRSSPLISGKEVISGVNDNKVFANAIGYVLGTYREPNLDGTLGDKTAMGHGTAFAITADGYLMTNRHVASMGVDDLVKKDLQGLWKKRVEIFVQKAKSASTLDEATKMAQIAQYCAEMAKVTGKPETKVDARLKVFIDQVPFDAKVVHMSERFDMAILKIDRKSGPFFGLATKNEPEQGLEIYTLGFPGIANDSRSEEDAAIEKMNAEHKRSPEESILPHHLRFSRTNGTVSRVIEDSGRKWEIEHTVQTFPGNSGGPIFDRAGTVVGLHYSGIAGTTGGKLNIALSAGQFKKEVDQFVGSGVHWRN